jgi:hypothetical protein
MFIRVKLMLYKNGHLFQERIAENEDDLYCRVEMDTGVGRFDTAGLYQSLLDKRCDHVTGTFRVCNSYEKWGAWQQEVVEITVRVERLSSGSWINTIKETLTKASERFKRGFLAKWTRQ